MVCRMDTNIELCTQHVHNEALRVIICCTGGTQDAAWVNSTFRAIVMSQLDKLVFTIELRYTFVDVR